MFNSLSEKLESAFKNIKGQARIRVQLSAAHEQSHLDKAIAAFTKVGKSLGVLRS